MDIKGLIIARGGSSRVPKKNVKEFFGGRNILQIKIAQLKELPQLSEVVVNSDSDEILDIARKESVTAIKRKAIFATTDCPIKGVYSNVASTIKCDYILFANCTSPLIKLQTLKDMLETNYTIFDSVNTVHWVKHYLWNKEHGCLYDRVNQPSSQDMFHTYMVNWAAAIVNRDYMINHGRAVGENWRRFFIEEKEAVDIDTHTDWELAKILWKEQLSLGTPQ